MRSVSSLVKAWVAASCLLACTSLLGIDGDYTLEESKGASGGAASGGRDAQNGGAATGGSVGPGGMTSMGGAESSGGNGAGGEVEAGAGGEGSGGTAGSGGTGSAGSDCAPGKKLCTVNDEELCVPPDPAVGCDLTSCEQCKPPADAFGMCEGTTCTFVCFDGFTKKDGACVPIAPPDAGNPGTGGRPTTCRADEDCAPCSREIRGCCALVPLGRCGCNFVWCVPTPG